MPFFPPRVPTVLGDEAIWHRFAGLRDRVEHDPGALDEVRRVLAPVESELWADADDRWASGQRGPIDSFAPEASRRIDAALAELGV